MVFKTTEIIFQTPEKMFCINRQLKTWKPPEKSLKVEKQKKTCVLCIYVFLGRVELEKRFSKQTTQNVQRCYFSSDVRLVFHTKPILASIRKDMLPLHYNNSFFYLFRCTCISCYIGRTKQMLDARIKQSVPTKMHNFLGVMMDNLRNTYGSSIAEHLLNDRDCAEKLCFTFFSVL